MLENDCTTWLRLVENVILFFRKALFGAPEEDVYIGWLIYTVLEPVCIIFILPCVILIFLLVSTLLIYMYKLRFYIWPTSFTRAEITECPRKVLHLTLQRLLATLWHIQGRIFHGVEIRHWERVPSRGPALFVFYHGTLPLDMYYFMAYYMLKFGKTPVAVVDRFLFHTPLLRTLMEVVRATPGSVESCVAQLAKNKVLILAPGGVREALFGNERYPIMWGRRCGFAKIAIKANIPIFPIFTENIREPIRSVQLGQNFFRWLYEKTRLPLVFLYGYFPVKLRIHVGEAIYWREEESAESYAKRVKQTIAEMIMKYQHVPGNISRALFQRIPFLDRRLRKRVVA